MLILRGEGRTELRGDEGKTASFSWAAGDLVAPPFHVWRRHEQVGALPARYLLVRNNFIERALGIKGNLSFDSELPERFPEVIEADRS